MQSAHGFLSLWLVWHFENVVSLNFIFNLALRAFKSCLTQLTKFIQLRLIHFPPFHTFRFVCVLDFSTDFKNFFSHSKNFSLHFSFEFFNDNKLIESTGKLKDFAPMEVIILLGECSIGVSCFINRFLLCWKEGPVSYIKRGYY